MSPKPKNVIFIMSDQHAAHLMGCAGETAVISPNMDRLAAEGTRFTQAYTQNPICLPSRVSFLSGQYCHNHGYYGNAARRPQNLPTYLGHFKRHGYRTAHFGKSHLPDDPEPWLSKDCDAYLDEQYNDYIRAKGQEPDHLRLPEFEKYVVDDARPSVLPFEDSYEGWHAQNTINFIKESEGQPFAIQFCLNRPHHALTPAQEFWDMYEGLDVHDNFVTNGEIRPPHFANMVDYTSQMEGRFEPKTNAAFLRRHWRGYLASITHIDHAIGQVLEYLDQTGLADNTIVVYGSDHGAYMGQLGVFEKAPGICSDLVCKVPYIWRGPGIPAAETCQALVENIDLGATLVDLCGLPPMDWVDGVSLRPLMEKEVPSIKDVAVTENPLSRSIRWGGWRLVHYHREMFGEKDEGELYHVAEDPFEHHNLYASEAHQARVHEGRRLLLDWLMKTSRTVCHMQTPNQEDSYAQDGKSKRSVSPAATMKTANDEDKVWMLNYL